MKVNKLQNFMSGFGAAVQLMRRAGDIGCFVEVVVLSTSVIDGLLRMGLILKYQLETGGDTLLEELLFQKEKDKIVTEREVYKRALTNGIINQVQFERLEILYIDRNRVIHRYIISDIKTSDVVRIAAEYDGIIDILNVTIKSLEDQQLTLRVGMTRTGIPISTAEIRALSETKHGSSQLAENFNRGKPPSSTEL